MKRMLFIYNIQAGTGRLRQALPQVLDIFTKNGFLVSAYPTQLQHTASKLVLKYGAEYDYLVCAGGDGTLSEVLDSIMLLEKKPKFGYIPCGSTNDFANSMCLPMSIPEAAYLVAGGSSSPIDIGNFQREDNNDFFSYVAAFGLFTDVAYRTPQGLKNALGHLAYVLEGAKRLTNIVTFPCLVELKNEKIEDEFIFGMVTNSTSIGGFSLPALQNTGTNDGKFLLLMLRKIVSIHDLGQVISFLMGNAHPDESLFVVRTIEKASFKFKGSVDWTLDGEFGGSLSCADIEIVKGGVELILPETNKSIA